MVDRVLDRPPARPLGPASIAAFVVGPSHRQGSRAASRPVDTICRRARSGPRELGSELRDQRLRAADSGSQPPRFPRSHRFARICAARSRSPERSVSPVQRGQVGHRELARRWTK